MRSNKLFDKERLLEGGGYKELPEKDGIVTLFRKIETNIFIFQYKGDEIIGDVVIDSEDLERIWNEPAIKVGDGKTPQE